MTSLFRILVLVVLSFSLSQCAEKVSQVEIPQPGTQNLVPNKHLSRVETCVPNLAWNQVNLPNNPVVTYDIAVYEAEKVDGGYESRVGVFYKENYPNTYITVDTGLRAKQAYLWTIRVRLIDGKVSQWSTNSKVVKSPLPPAEYNNHWHGFLTPEGC